MPSIGGVEFIEKQGPSLLAPRTVVEDISRPRVAGHAFRDMGLKSSPVVWVTTVDVDDPEFTDLLYESMQGEIVTVVDDDAKDTVNVMIIEVQVLEKKKVIRTAGGVTAGLWIVTAQWVLQGC
jgi:hypothetical protein